MVMKSGPRKRCPGMRSRSATAVRRRRRPAAAGGGASPRRHRGGAASSPSFQPWLRCGRGSGRSPRRSARSERPAETSPKSAAPTQTRRTIAAAGSPESAAAPIVQTAIRIAASQKVIHRTRKAEPALSGPLADGRARMALSRVYWLCWR